MDSTTSVLLVKLILAHFIGDFLLQPKKWVQDKEEKKWRSVWLYVHVAIHGLLLMFIVGNRFFWEYVVIITVSHLLIDGAKLSLQLDHTRRLYFFVDQLLHLGVIVGAWAFFEKPEITTGWLNSPHFLITLLGILFLTTPAAYITKNLIAAWAPDTGDLDGDSLANAGKYIGILERLFVFAFILGNHWEAVGFLITAKSVFRFGDLRDSKDRKLTEYILIGTLISFGLAIISGMFYLQIIDR